MFGIFVMKHQHLVSLEHELKQTEIALQDASFSLVDLDKQLAEHGISDERLANSKSKQQYFEQLSMAAKSQKVSKASYIELIGIKQFVLEDSNEAVPKSVLGIVPKIVPEAVPETVPLLIFKVTVFVKIEHAQRILQSQLLILPTELLLTLKPQQIKALSLGRVSWVELES